MALRSHDGDYVPSDRGGLAAVEGEDEVTERALFKLTVRRGSFPLLPELGSRLYLLARERPSDADAAAEACVREALADEESVTVTDVRTERTGDAVTVAVTLEHDGKETELRLSV